MSTASSILGVYKAGIPLDEPVKVHTPDPTKYHDPAVVRLGTPGDYALAAVLGHSHGFAGWRGTIIPHATELGGSMGHDPHAPAREVYIDPELNNRAIVIDMSQFKGDEARAALAAASSQARAQINDPRDAAVVTWGQFAQPLGGHHDATQVTVKQGGAQANTSGAEVRLPPVQMPGVYVVPKALPGGGQAAALRQPPPAASFGSPAPHPALEQARSLHAAFENGQRDLAPVPTTPAQRPMRQVTFELPPPFGQLHVQYHDVVRNGMTLVLVYDHSRPMQMVWFPPVPVDEPAPIAALVYGAVGQPNMLYLVYPTGLSFTYESREFVVLTIDKEKTMEPGATP